jgi:hypothetical protein
MAQRARAGAAGTVQDARRPNRRGLWHNDHRAWSEAHKLLWHTADEEAGKSTVAALANHDRFCILFARDLEDGLGNVARA